MRFMLCKFHCSSFICFCKSSSHIYTPGPLKLENAPQVPSTTVASVSDEAKNGTAVENLNRSQIDGGFRIKSSLKKKKKLAQGVEEAKKKKVQWMDFHGNDLVEIREFDSCEADELDPQSDKSNMCIIL